MIVFIVVAAAAPLAAIVGTIPLGFVLGNGAGLPAAFALATLCLVLFAAGYAAMARRVVNTGAFYTYVASGLGRPVALSAALVAVIAYNAQTIGTIGGFGYFTELGLSVPWWAAALGGIAVVGVLGYRSINVGARVLGVLMVGEMLMLLLLDVGVIRQLGWSAFPLDSFSPDVVAPGLANAVLLAFSTFVGFESAALYGEETTRPSRSIPRATYASVLVIGVLYTLTAWVAVGAGAMGRLDSLESDDYGMLFFDLMTEYVGAWAAALMGAMVLTSLLAAILATHNAAARYMFALGRESVLPKRLGGVHDVHLSPHVASLSQSTLSAAVVVAFAVVHLDPYLNLAASMIALGTLGIVSMQAAAAFSVPRYFARNGGGHWFRTGLAPVLGGLGLATAVLLTATHYSTLTSTDSAAVNALPWLYVVVVTGGLGFALWLRRRRPQVYAELARSSPYTMSSLAAEAASRGD